MSPSDGGVAAATSGSTEFNDGSMSGQLGDDRSERISGVGAHDDI